MQTEVRYMITYKVVKNVKYGDYRVAQYVNGTWNNEFDGNWSKGEAHKNKEYLMASSGLEFYIS